MKHTKLYPILFEADDALLSGGDIGKDVADAVKTALEPVTKDVEQMKKDINVIQKSSGERKQEPTKARSTTGPEQTSAATTIPKGPGTKSTTETSTTLPSSNNIVTPKDLEKMKTDLLGAIQNDK
jgi:hypothetical protein